MLRLTRNFFLKALSKEMKLLGTDKTPKRHVSTPSQKAITLAFTQQETNTLNFKKISASLKKAEAEVRDLKEKQQSIEPCKLSARSQKDIEDMASFIINSIENAILEGKTEIKKALSDRYQASSLEFLRPILKAYGMSFNKVSASSGRTENLDYLQLGFPENFYRTSLPFQEGNSAYNSWLRAFDERIELAYKAAKDKSTNDFLLLRDQLLDPLLVGVSHTFSHLEPCPAAFSLLKKLADTMDIDIARQGSIITAARRLLEEEVATNLPKCLR